MKRLSFLLALLLIVGTLISCAGRSTKDTETTTETDKVTETEPAVKTTLDVIALKGPTGMGMVKLMEDNDKKTTNNDYSFKLVSSPEEISAEIIKGNFHVAAVPSNLAAVLHSKTQGEIQIAAVNTLGVLYLLENGDTIQSVADLKGKTIYATGQASTPEYILRYILKENGINPDTDVTINYLSDHSELATLMTSGNATIGVLPEPFVTTTLSNNQNVRIALDLTEEWDKAAPEGSRLIQGVIIVNKSFARENKAAVDIFLNEYKASVDFVNANTDEASALIEKYGIVAKAALAKKALPNCNICFIDGEDMKKGLNPFFGVLFDANPASVGGAVPADEIYYAK